MIKLPRITMALLVTMMVSCSKEEIGQEPDVDTTEFSGLNKRIVDPINQTDFVTTWKGTEISIPTDSNFIYDYSVDWDNDGIMDETNITGDVTHTFESAGKHTIRISGLFPAIAFENSTQANRSKIAEINQWGQNSWQTMHRAFFRCNNLEVLTKDAPVLKAVKDYNGMFTGAGYGVLEVRLWDVSNAEDMSEMFYLSKFREINVSKWDVSNVKNMAFMFSGTTITSLEVSNWDVSNVTDTRAMFYLANSINPDVSNWDVSNVTNMLGMFARATSANPNVSDWDVSSVTNMSALFIYAESANPDVSKWDVSNVTNMSDMFSSTINANPDVSNWDVSSVTNMKGMFDKSSANPDVSKWDVSNVTNMKLMFSYTDFANPDVSNWDVSNVTDTGLMFIEAFEANPDVSNWRISNVKNMNAMFLGARSFSVESFEQLLISFANQPHQKNVKLDADVNPASKEALIAMQDLIYDGWTINGVQE